MNKTQLQTTTASLVGIAAGFVAGKGWLGLSLADWTTIFTALAAGGAVLGPAVWTRALALKDTVGQFPQTTVITNPADARALPDNPDVVAVTPEIVAAIKKAQ